MPLIIKNYNPEIADTAPHILGVSSNITDNIDYVENITDIIGFRDNPLPNDYEEDKYTWGLCEYIWSSESHEWSSDLVQLEKNITQFEYTGFKDLISYVYPLSDSETECYDIIIVSGDAHDNTKVWNRDWEYVSDIFDLDLPVPIVDKLGLIDDIREWISIVYEEWETTIWDYEQQWNNDKVWIWEGKGTVILVSTSDIVGFLHSISTNQDYLIPVPETIGFDDTFSWIEVAIFIYDHLGLQSIPEYLGITTEKIVTDELGLQDLLTINYYNIVNIIIDKVGLHDALSSQFTTWNYLYDDCAFRDNPFTRDHILYWRSRTHNYVMGFGGGPYGDFEYGGGESNDIKEFRVRIFGAKYTLLRDNIISFSDKTDDDPHFVYSWADNISDNTFFRHELTFDVYENDTTGKYSEKRTVSKPRLTNPLSISSNIAASCAFWGDADQITGIGHDQPTGWWYSLNGTGNYFRHWDYCPRYMVAGSVQEHACIKIFKDAYSNGYYYDSYTGLTYTGKCTIFAYYTVSGSSRAIHRDFGEAAKTFYLDVHNSSQNNYYFYGWVYNGMVALDGKWHLAGCRIGGTGIDSYAYKDGITLAHNQNGVYCPDRLVMSVSAGTMYISEFMYFNNTLADWEINELTGYFMDKYRM